MSQHKRQAMLYIFACSCRNLLLTLSPPLSAHFSLMSAHFSSPPVDELESHLSALHLAHGELQTSYRAVCEKHAALKEEHAKMKAQFEASAEAVSFSQLQAAHDKLNADHARVVRQYRAASSAASHTCAVWLRATSCGLCSKSFTMFFRRHHCRSCGTSVCAKCSVDKAMTVGAIGSRPVRACTECISDAEAKKASAPQLSARTRTRTVSNAAAAVPPAPPMAPPLAPALMSPPPPPAPPAPAFCSPRATRSAVGFNPADLSSVKLRASPAASSSAAAACLGSPSAGGESDLLAAIRSYHRSKSLLRTPAPRAIAKTTSPQQSALKSGDAKRTPGRGGGMMLLATPARSTRPKSPVDLMTQLRSSMAARRQQIEWGSEKKQPPMSAQRRVQPPASCKKLAPPPLPPRMHLQPDASAQAGEAAASSAAPEQQAADREEDDWSESD